MGGCGKTALGLATAQAARDAGLRVFWVAAAELAGLAAAMLEVAAACGASSVECEQARVGHRSLLELVWARLDRAPFRWVVVFDSADDPDVLAGEGYPVAAGNGWV